jgi:hypothetical protein
MAFIDGYVRGKPARIADNLIRLFPEVYSADPPQADQPAADSTSEVDVQTEPAAKGRKSRKDN